MKLPKILTIVLLMASASIRLSAAHFDVGVNVGLAPPPPPVVVGPVGVAPGPDYVWINGYWNWVGGRWVWVGGRWERRPHPGAVWAAPFYHREGDHFHFHAGHWR